MIPRLLKIALSVSLMIGCGAGPTAEVIAPAPQPIIEPAVESWPNSAERTPPESPDVPADASPIIIAAVGDIMPGSVTPIPFVPEPADRHIPEEIRLAIPDADLVFGNLEGSFMVDGIAPAKCRPESREAGRCYEFGSPPFLASFLKNAGFTVLSLDNNHAEDYGPEGYVFTQGLLAQLGVVAVPKRTPVFLPIRRLTVAVVPFGFSGRSFHVSDLETARMVVSAADQHADIVIVSFHGGAEGENASRVVDATEEYFEEDRGNVVRFAHTVVDAGADLVLGHGPHVPRAVELYQGRLIAYSLGNFWTYGNISIKGTKGVMPLLHARVARDGTFLSGRLISMRQRLPGIPELDPDNTASRLIAALSREDFPWSSLTVTETGELRVDRQDLRETETCDPSSECSEAGLSQPD